MRNSLLACLTISASGVIIPSKHSSCSGAHDVLQHPRPACVPTTLMNVTGKSNAAEFQSLVDVTFPQRYTRRFTPEGEEKNKHGMNIYFSKFTNFRLPIYKHGVGERSGAVIWSMVVVLPFAVSLVIAFFPSWISRDYFTKVKSFAVLVSLYGSILFSFCAGGLCRVTLFHPDYADISSPPSFLAFGQDSEGAKRCMFVVYLLLCFACSSTCFHFAYIEFALPHLGMRKYPFVLSLKVVITFVVSGASFAASYYSKQGSWYTGQTNFLVSCFGYYFVQFCLIGYLPAGIPTLIVLSYTTLLEFYNFAQWGDTSPGYLFSVSDSLYYPRNSMAVVCVALCNLTVYTRDRKFVALTGFTLVFAFELGCVLLYYRQLGTHTELNKLEVAVSIMFLFLPYPCTLFARCQRVLPEALQMVKYLHIGYLREMRSEQMPGHGRTMAGQLAMKRCQEMPDYAFGNVTKASKLIIISHRWLDRYSCDMVTPECPIGLRITTLLETLDAFFPYSWAGFWASVRAKEYPSIFYGACDLLQSVQLGSHDVLVFIDFMCIPQIGKTTDGTLIERTPEEETIFTEALPAMGGLYTMYDVMVRPEVPKGVACYESSGWCFCEWESAYLSSKLDNYKTFGSTIYNQRPQFNKVFDDSVASEYMNYFENELKQKHFLHPSDADVVRGIVQGKVLHRMLVDAVETQHVGRVERLLGELSNKGLLSMLINSPVDERTLDTLLHRSVRLPSNEIDQILIRHGARWDVRNFRGDTPFQVHMLPRFWESAFWEAGVAITTMSVK